MVRSFNIKVGNYPSNYSFTISDADATSDATSESGDIDINSAELLNRLVICVIYS